MSTMLPQDLERFAEQEVANGNYPSVEAVVSEGVRLLREQKLKALRDDLQAAADQVARGEVIEIRDEKASAEFFADIKRRGREWLRAKKGES